MAGLHSIRHSPDDIQIRGISTTGPPPRERHSFSRARIRALGKLKGKGLRYLPAHPGYYRTFFKGLHPEHCGLTLSRIRNIKSDVLFALKRTGCIGGTHTYMAPFSPAWQLLWDEAECAGGLRRYGSRLMHFCSAQGIPPDQVSDGVAERFLEALVEESFVLDPVHSFKNIQRTWNNTNGRCYCPICAHSLIPMDMIVSGWSMSSFQEIGSAHV